MTNWKMLVTTTDNLTNTVAAFATREDALAYLGQQNYEGRTFTLVYEPSEVPATSDSMTQNSELSGSALVAAVKAEANSTPEWWSDGSAAWKALRAIRDDLADEVIENPDLDPWGCDENLPAFYEWLERQE